MRNAQLVDPSPTKRAAARGSAAASPQTATGRPYRSAASVTRRTRRRTAGWNDVAISASAGFVRSGGKRVLDEIVRADAEEVDDRGERVGEDRDGRDLDHDAEPDVARDLCARAARCVARRFDRRPSGGNLVDRGDHRKEDPQRRGRVGLEERPELRLQQVRPAEPEAEPADTESRIHLGIGNRVRGGLVAAYVERPEDNRLAR